MGFRGHRILRHIAACLAIALLVPMLGVGAVPLAANAQAQTAFDIPEGRLSSSIRTIARQAGISIASSETGLRRTRANALRGRMSTAEALRRVLAGTPYRAVAIGNGGFRVERRPARPTPSAPRPAPTPIRALEPVSIIVEGSKRQWSKRDYPGGVTLIRLDDPAFVGVGEALDTVLGDIPSANGTALGSGRNKIFLRGIADSSFNGPTQSTIGLYLGEQRLIFSAPNPDLRLYDMESVELLEGPQGTLYGAGALGGLLRVNPRAPDVSGIAGEGWGGLGLTEGGGVNWDLGGVVNLPISSGSALRVVGYGGEESGFIDDPARGLEAINRGSHYGGRAALSADLGPDWSVELSGFGQHTQWRDGQYLDDTLPDYARTDLVAQPFRGRIYGGGVTLRGFLGDAELVTTTGLVDHSLRSTFDSSVLTQSGPMMMPGRQAFRETREIRLITHETRLSGTAGRDVTWLLGIGALRNRDDMQQLVDTLGGNDPPPFARLRYRLDEFALFGEGSYAFDPHWTLTAGGRLLYTKARGERSFGPNTVVEPREGPARFLPALALSWEPDATWLAYLRVQQGFRTGGVTIERDQNRDPTTARFDPDKVRSYEAGLRGRFGSATALEFELTAHHADWDDIQADLLDMRGFPITRNIGDGTVTGVEASMQLETPSGWRLAAAGSWHETDVLRVLPDGNVREVAIPNVPDISLLGRIAKSWERSNGDVLGVSLSGRYVGRSFLDLDQQVRVEQGDYARVDAAAWWQAEAMELRLEALNLTRTRGNRFAFGNPFTARLEDQVTPLRPLTVRLQVTLRQ